MARRNVANSVSSSDEERLLREASDASTSPDRLREIASTLKFAPRRRIYREIGARIAAHPNLPPELMPLVIRQHPAAFLSNPILPLLPLEMPNVFEEARAEGMLGLLRFKQVPAGIVVLFTGNADETVAQTARYHVALPRNHPAFVPDLEAHWVEYATAAFRKLPYWDSSSLSELRDVGFSLPSSPAEAVPDYSAVVREIVAFRALSPPRPLPDRPWLGLPAPSDPIPEDAPELAEALDERTSTARLNLLNERADTLRSLPGVILRNALALHPNADDALMHHLYEIQANARVALAMNPSLPRDLILTLAVNPSRLVRRLIRIHPTVRTDPALEEEVHAAVRALLHKQLDGEWKELERYYAPAAIHARFGPPDKETEESPNWLVRLGVALNPYTSERARLRLRSGDGCRLVRAAARARLADPNALFGV
jgi:hypothetical protein